jgi:hypothetical protein
MSSILVYGQSDSPGGFAKKLPKLGRLGGVSWVLARLRSYALTPAKVPHAVEERCYHVTALLQRRESVEWSMPG